MIENYVSFSGMISADPQVRKINDKLSLTTYSIVQNRHYKVKEEFKQETIFINAKVWDNNQAGLVKGDNVLVIGKLKQNSWEDKEGKKHSMIEIDPKDIIKLPKTEKKQQESKQTTTPVETNEAGGTQWL